MSAPPALSSLSLPSLSASVSRQTQCQSHPPFSVSKCENIQDHMPLKFCGRDFLLLARNTWLQLPLSQDRTKIRGKEGSPIEFFIHSCTASDSYPIEQLELCEQLSNHTLFAAAPCPDKFIPSQLTLWARAVGPVIVAAHVELVSTVAHNESIFRVRFIPPLEGLYRVEVKHYWLGGEIERPSLERNLPPNVERQTYDRYFWFVNIHESFYSYLGGFFADGLGLINGAWFGRSDGRDEKSDVFGLPVEVHVEKSSASADYLYPGTSVPLKWCSAATARALMYSSLNFSNVPVSANLSDEKLMMESPLSEHNIEYGYDSDSDELVFNNHFISGNQTFHVEPHWVSIQTWSKALESESPVPSSHPNWLLHGGLNAFRYTEGYDVFVSGDCRYHFFTREQVLFELIL